MSAPAWCRPRRRLDGSGAGSCPAPGEASLTNATGAVVVSIRSGQRKEASAMSSKERKTVVVGVDPKHQKDVKKLIGRLQKKGFKLEQELASIGVLTGSVPEDALEGLKEVDGVAN